MTILNLMLGKGRGGLEQAAVDYAEALALAKIPNLTIVSPGAWVAAPLVNAALQHESLINRGKWDLFAAKRLRKLAAKTHATAIICHGNRALSLALSALQGRIHIIAVAHNYSNRRFTRADHCFAITHHLAQHLAAMGITKTSIIPNMVHVQQCPPRAAFANPPRIGSMGRFNPKKGFRVYIEALAVLRNRGIAFQAILGGDGEEAKHLDNLIQQCSLTDTITRTGWVQNKTAFFDELDLFVLPSLEEAFGLVLIEAMSHRLPVVSTDAPGPREIIRQNETGLIVSKNSPEAMADAIAALIANPTHAKIMGDAAREQVVNNYSFEAMAQRLQTALAPYMTLP